MPGPIHGREGARQAMQERHHRDTQSVRKPNDRSDDEENAASQAGDSCDAKCVDDVAPNALVNLFAHERVMFLAPILAIALGPRGLPARVFGVMPLSC